MIMNNEISNYQPQDISWLALWVRLVWWLITWSLIWLLIFAISVLFGSLFTKALEQVTNQNIATDPVLWMILLVIWFITWIVWSTLTSIITWLVEWEKYPSIITLIKLSFVPNIILFLVIAPAYLVRNNDIIGWYAILSIHTVLSIFIAQTMIDISSQPTYSASSLMGSSLWLGIYILIFSVLFKMFSAQWSQVASDASTLQILLSIPPLLAYTLIPFVSWLWTKIYFVIGTDLFYTATYAERMVSQSQDITPDAINVDTINVDT